jgi:hypothetical protein
MPVSVEKEVTAVPKILLRAFNRFFTRSKIANKLVPLLLSEKTLAMSLKTLLNNRIKFTPWTRKLNPYNNIPVKAAFKIFNHFENLSGKL